jgi:hypothetical protein
MEYDDRLKPLPVWLILEYASSVLPDTYIIFTDRGNHIPSDIQTYGINVFDVSLIGNENQSHSAVIIVSCDLWYVSSCYSVLNTIKDRFKTHLKFVNYDILMEIPYFNYITGIGRANISLCSLLELNSIGPIGFYIFSCWETSQLRFQVRCENSYCLGPRFVCNLLILWIMNGWVFIEEVGTLESWRTSSKYSRYTAFFSVDFRVLENKLLLLW